MIMNNNIMIIIRAGEKGNWEVKYKRNFYLIFLEKTDQRLLMQCFFNYQNYDDITDDITVHIHVCK